MDQSRVNELGAPWWYRIPKYPLGAITYSVAAIVIYMWVSQSAIAWGIGGAVAATVVGFLHGMAQGAYNVRRR